MLWYLKSLSVSFFHICVSVEDAFSPHKTPFTPTPAHTHPTTPSPIPVFRGGGRVS